MTHIDVEVDIDYPIFEKWRVGDIVTIRYAGKTGRYRVVANDDGHSCELVTIEEPPPDIDATGKIP